METILRMYARLKSIITAETGYACCDIIELVHPTYGKGLGLAMHKSLNLSLVHLKAWKGGNLIIYIACGVRASIRMGGETPVKQLKHV
jgi:hypothetical protein